MSGSDVRARVAALAEAEPALADDLMLRGTLIEIVDRASVSLPAPRLPADLVRARLPAGVPLLDRLDVPLAGTASALFERLAVAMLADPGARAAAEAVLIAARAHHLHPEQLVGEAMAGHDDHLAALAASDAGAAQLIASLADLAARPLLAAIAARLRPALGLAAWERGYCPVCGGRALLAEASSSRSPAQAEGGQGVGDALRCGRCATSWAWSLPRCPDCPDGRLTVLDTLDAPEIGRWRLAGCDACRSYLKLADAPRDDRLATLLVDDLATWRLDRAALRHGLARPSGTGYRLEHGDVGGEELDDD